MSYVLTLAEAITTQVNTRKSITDTRIISFNGDEANATITESLTQAKNHWKVWANQMKSVKLSSGWKFTPDEEDDDDVLRFSRTRRMGNRKYTHQECVYTYRVWKIN